MSHFFKSLVQSYVYLLCLDPARNDSLLLVKSFLRVRSCEFVSITKYVRNLVLFKI